MKDYEFDSLRKRFFGSLKELLNFKVYKEYEFEGRIDKFRSRYGFLSNFYESRICVNFLDSEFLTSEHFYQSMKPFSYRQFLLIKSAVSPKSARYLGKNCKIWPDFYKYRDIIMYYALYLKFKQNEELRRKLIDTRNFYLEEKNYWHDNYFGNCYCKRCRNKVGKNRLGQLLMNLRESFIKNDKYEIFNN